MSKGNHYGGKKDTGTRAGQGSNKLHNNETIKELTPGSVIINPDTGQQMKLSPVRAGNGGLSESAAYTNNDREKIYLKTVAPTLLDDTYSYQTVVKRENDNITAYTPRLDSSENIVAGAPLPAEERRSMERVAVVKAQVADTFINEVTGNRNHTANVEHWVNAEGDSLIMSREVKKFKTFDEITNTESKPTGRARNKDGTAKNAAYYDRPECQSYTIEVDGKKQTGQIEGGKINGMEVRGLVAIGLTGAITGNTDTHPGNIGLVRNSDHYQAVLVDNKYVLGTKNDSFYYGAENNAMVYGGTISAKKSIDLSAAQNHDAVRSIFKKLFPTKEDIKYSLNSETTSFAFPFAQGIYADRNNNIAPHMKKELFETIAGLEDVSANFANNRPIQQRLQQIPPDMENCHGGTTRDLVRDTLQFRTTQYANALAQIPEYQAYKRSPEYAAYMAQRSPQAQPQPQANTTAITASQTTAASTSAQPPTQTRSGPSSPIDTIMDIQAGNSSHLSSSSQAASTAANSPVNMTPLTPGAASPTQQTLAISNALNGTKVNKDPTQNI